MDGCKSAASPSFFTFKHADKGPDDRGRIVALFSFLCFLSGYAGLMLKLGREGCKKVRGGSDPRSLHEKHGHCGLMSRAGINSSVFNALFSCPSLLSSVHLRLGQGLGALTRSKNPGKSWIWKMRLKSPNVYVTCINLPRCIVGMRWDSVHARKKV